MSDTPGISKSVKPPLTNQPAAPKSPSFDDEIQRFAHDVESLETTLPEVMRFLTSVVEEQNNKLINFLDAKAIEKLEEKNETTWTLAPDSVPVSRQLQKLVAMTSRVVRLIPKDFIVSLISQYDAFLGRIIRLMYLAKPDLLNASERSITFSQLMQFGSIEDARDRIIEKEVETVLRNSHADQFAWLEKKLDIPLKKELNVWPMFIEVTERRNLFVHCDGIVSEQYLRVCKDHGANLEASCKVGMPLGSNSKYFRKACDIVLEIAVKLGHVVWLKLLPNDRDEAESRFNQLCLDLISREKYSLATVLLDFALKFLLRKNSSAGIRWMLTVNLAQAHKWNGDEEKAKPSSQTTIGMFSPIHSALRRPYWKTIMGLRLK